MRARLSVAQALRAIGRPVFTTREIAAIRDGSVAATSQSLGRLENEGLLVRVARGVWCDPADPRFTPFALVHFLAGGHPACVARRRSRERESGANVLRPRERHL